MKVRCVKFHSPVIQFLRNPRYRYFNFIILCFAISWLFFIGRKTLLTPIADLSRPNHDPNATATTTTTTSNDKNKTHLLPDPDSPHPQCVNLRRPLESEINRRNTYWQAYDNAQNDADIVVYSAFYDDREIVGRQPWIRILGVRRKSNEPLWCYVWYPESAMPVVARSEIVVTGRIHNVIDGRQRYNQCLFSCPLTRTTDSAVPSHVSLVTRPCNGSTIFLPVQRPLRRSNGSYLHEFSVCLEVNFGYFPPEWISEWMEVHSMLGVTKVDVYNGSIDARMDAVFDYYRRRGLVEMHQMPPAVNDYSSEGIRLGSPASLNDCMMRNMYVTRFLVVVDFDEIIVPRVHRTYGEMLAAVDRSSDRRVPFHTYSFRNAYFLNSFPHDESQPAFSKTLRLRHRAPPSEYLWTTKSFVDPRLCKSVFNHYCYVLFDQQTGPTSIDVNASFALLHHYRVQCPSDDAKECASFAETKVRDDVMLNYKKELIERVSKVLKDI